MLSKRGAFQSKKDFKIDQVSKQRDDLKQRLITQSLQDI